MKRNVGAGPGGVRQTEKKKRRLEAIEQKSKNKKQKSARGTAAATTGARPKHDRKSRFGVLPPPAQQEAPLHCPVASVGDADDYAPLDPDFLLDIERCLKLSELSDRQKSDYVRDIMLSTKEEARGQEQMAALGSLARAEWVERDPKATAPLEEKQRPALGKLLSNTAAKKAGLGLQASEITQAVADKLHTLWTDFAVRLVRKGAAKGELAEVVRRHLDFHGCKLKVVEAANPMHVGIVGVCVENSGTSVHLAAHWLNAGPHAGPGLKLSTVPKRGSRFEFAFPTGASTHRTVTLLGDLIKGRTVTS